MAGHPLGRRSPMVTENTLDGMKKLPLTTAAILSVSLLTLSGCAQASGLSSSIEQAADEADTTLVLSSLASDDVTDFLVVCPYESPDSVADRLGFAWSGGPDYTDIEDKQTIAFIDGDGIASSAELSRTAVDFCGSGQWEATPIDTPLTVTRTADIVQVRESA